jgi:protein phosphatase
VVNVGDSRCYLYRRKSLIQLSYDQNLGNEMRDEMGWSDEQVAGFPQRSVLTAAIGSASEIPVRETSIGLLPGDLILMCSDGLYGPVGDEGIAEILRRGLEPQECLKALVDKANAAGGPDNITVVLFGEFF